MVIATILFRPIGQNELARIQESSYAAFPPRLSYKPIFYPVVYEEYAVQIARDWNAQNGKSGYVTRFLVRGDFLVGWEADEVTLDSAPFSTPFPQTHRAAFTAMGFPASCAP